MDPIEEKLNLENIDLQNLDMDKVCKLFEKFMHNLQPGLNSSDEGSDDKDEESDEGSDDEESGEGSDDEESGEGSDEEESGEGSEDEECDYEEDDDESDIGNMNVQCTVCKDIINDNNYIITSSSFLIHTKCIENIISEKKDKSLDEILEDITNKFLEEIENEEESCDEDEESDDEDEESCDEDEESDDEDEESGDEEESDILKID
jgi:hypothetical protein